MLFFVVNTDFQQIIYFLILIFGKKAFDGLSNVVTIGIYFFYGGSRKITTIRAHHTLPHRFVIAIKDEGKVGVEDCIALCTGLQNELLKKPSGVSQMPFWGRNINDRLHYVVFDFQRFTNMF